FPSGHGARVGVNLVWLPHLVPGGRLWAPLLALWIGWSRVALGIHYVGDVVAGCLVGMVIGVWTRREDKEEDAAFGKSASD
ncbi:phosphatase PAP2 family protein, partial [Candidatus Parcubacteria bacterium]